MSDRYDRAAKSLNEALEVIDRLGEYFQAEHTWMNSENWVDYEWPEKVNTRVDHLGYVVPELYETLIHLAHSLREVLLELGER